MKHIKNYKYIKSLCITNLISVLLMIATITLTLLINFYKIDLSELNKNYIKTYTRIFASIGLFAIYWLMMFSGTIYIISFINIAFYSSYYIKETNQKIYKYIIGFIPFISFFILISIKVSSNKQEYVDTLIYFKKYFIIYSLYFGTLVNLVSSSALYFVLSEKISSTITSISGIFIVIIAVWNSIALFVLLILGVILIIRAVIRIEKYDKYFATEKQKLSLKSYLFCPIIATHKTLVYSKNM